MAEEASAKVIDVAGSNPGTTTVRQRKKRKWDQPAESVLSAGFPIPGMVSFAGVGVLPGFGLPGMVPPLAGVIPSDAITSAFISSPQVSPSTSLVQQNAAAIVQKINQDLATKGLLPQPKIQDELIAREIVINDADPTVRYKLTKRQTQEEIQAKTGAVVITRGKYRSPNGPIESEKPLYLHISSVAHLKDTAERIKAVEQAALMVEEILKQGRQPQSASTLLCAVPATGALATPPFSTAVFVGLEADPTLHLVSRIRGPNDQYINHIMNETGATIVLRGRGSENYEGLLGEEIQQPLHLFIFSDNAKSLDDAKTLADNLLETVRSECLKFRAPTYQIAVAGSIAAPAMPTVSAQLSVTPYQVPSYANSFVGVGPYATVYSQAVISHTQTHNLQSLPSNTYSLSSSIPQPGSANSLNLMATEIINKSSSTRVYNAVPPPRQLLSESAVSMTDMDKSDQISASESSSSGTDLAIVTSSSSNVPINLPAHNSSSIATLPNLVCTGVYGTPGASSNTQNFVTAPPGLPLSYGQLTPASYPQLHQNQKTQTAHIVAATSGTSYNGYGGIYPQATPLQQVALALQRPPPPLSVKPGSLTSANGPTKAQSTCTDGQSEKQPPKRRKFQELPVAPKEPSQDNQNSRQGTIFFTMGGLSEQPISKKLQSMPPPKGLPMGPPKGMPPVPPSRSISPSSKSMPPPSSKSMPPPSSKSMQPPQTVSTELTPKSNVEDTFLHETSLKLVEYGEEDDDDLSIPGAPKENGTQYANGKPFWAP